MRIFVLSNVSIQECKSNRLCSDSAQKISKNSALTFRIQLRSARAFLRTYTNKRFHDCLPHPNVIHIAVPATASLSPMALAITLVKVITLAASLRCLEAKFGGVGGGENGLWY